MDYEITRHELDEANSLCHGNWIEIQRLYDRIHLLESIFSDAGIDYPIV